MQLAGIGHLLVFDEFFEFPNSTGLRLRDPNTLLESVIYYCDESSAVGLGEFNDAEEFRPRHGVHLYFKSNLRSMNQEATSGGLAMHDGDSCVLETGGSLVLPVIDHVRDASSIDPTIIDNVAAVRVIAGNFGNVSVGPPLHDFVSTSSPAVCSASSIIFFKHELLTYSHSEHTDWCSRFKSP